MEEKEQIKEINQHISDALEQWANVMLTADANEWAYLLNYSDQDALNAIFIFNHVLSNIGIKNGTLNDKNVIEKSKELREFIKDYCGLDTVEITRKSLGITLENEENGNKS
jgi:hypothetical protein